jgi:hypothetical protein
MLTGAPPFVGDTLMATCVRGLVPAVLQHACVLRCMRSARRVCRRSYDLISGEPLALPPALAGTPGTRMRACSAILSSCEHMPHMCFH